MVTAAPSKPNKKEPPGATHPSRILLAKIGLDGHDRGVKVLARSFRDAGIEVIYTGLWQTCEATMYAALQEDVDVIGVSLLSAAHMTVMPELLRLREELGLTHTPLVLGGIVPDADYPKLIDMGVAAVFKPGSSIDDIVTTMSELTEKRRLTTEMNDVPQRFADGDARALAQVITAIQRNTPLEGWSPPKGSANVVGITGAPGVGKSSFIGKLGVKLRSRGRRVAVIAIDPSSPITGGALLGDRLRMMRGTPDDAFFIRSLSTAGGQAARPSSGALSPHCAEIVRAMTGFGFDDILVETVGAGQADVAVAELVDRTLLLLMPESGDSIQFSKAGIMEIADGFVLNKCDLPGADATEAQLRGALSDDRTIWKVSAVRDVGIDAVADWVAKS